MINYLDSTLQTLLASNETGLDKEHVYFDTPDDTFAPSKPAINLFLYDVRENRDLRSNEWQLERHNGVATRQAPFVRVDCSYLVTAWAGDISSEHELLGKVMRVLLRYPTIPAAVLQEDLAKQQSLPLLTSSLQPGKLQSLAEFWQAIGGKPKATLHYTVTICVDVHEPVEAGPLVTDVIIRFGPPTQEE